jgi:hypothetical protein
MIVLDDDRGHVVVSQAEHAAMCAEMGRAWGNDRFGPVEPAEEVCLAAEQHEIGMRDWDLAPDLDPDTGLPATVTRIDIATHLPLRLEGPRRLARQSPYAALIASRHHTSFYVRPRGIALLRRPARQIRSYLDASAEFRRDLSEQLGLLEHELDRNWRLVRTWDGLSHDLLLDRAPCTRHGVPAADGAYVDLRLERRGDGYRLDPWPFAAERIVVHAGGRLLEQTFTNERRMREALARAPEVVLTYELAHQ